MESSSMLKKKESAQGTHIYENAQTHGVIYLHMTVEHKVSNFKVISACNGQIGLFRDPIHHI